MALFRITAPSGAVEDNVTEQEVRDFLRVKLSEGIDPDSAGYIVEELPEVAKLPDDPTLDALSPRAREYARQWLAEHPGKTIKDMEPWDAIKGIGQSVMDMFSIPGRTVMAGLNKITGSDEDFRGELGKTHSDSQSFLGGLGGELLRSPMTIPMAMTGVGLAGAPLYVTAPVFGAESALGAAAEGSSQAGIVGAGILGAAAPAVSSGIGAVLNRLSGAAKQQAIELINKALRGNAPPMNESELLKYLSTASPEQVSAVERILNWIGMGGNQTRMSSLGARAEDDMISHLSESVIKQTPVDQVAFGEGVVQPRLKVDNPSKMNWRRTSPQGKETQKSAPKSLKKGEILKEQKAFEFSGDPASRITLEGNAFRSVNKEVVDFYNKAAAAFQDKANTLLKTTDGDFTALEGGRGVYVPNPDNYMKEANKVLNNLFYMISQDGGRLTKENLSREMSALMERNRFDILEPLGEALQESGIISKEAYKKVLKDVITKKGTRNVSRGMSDAGIFRKAAEKAPVIGKLFPAEGGYNPSTIGLAKFLDLNFIPGKPAGISESLLGDYVTHPSALTDLLYGGSRGFRRDD